MISESDLPSFLIVIYFYQPTDSCRFSHAEHGRKHVLFRDIIRSASVEEARKEAISNFWEQEIITRRKSDAKRDAAGHLQKSLPDDFYVDARILHTHEITREWGKIFIHMEGFHTMDKLFEKLRITRSGKLHQSKRGT